MTCSADIASILIKILRAGILRIRAAGWEGDAERCALEADHIHNLPNLLSNFNADQLRYYWDTERVAYRDQIEVADVGLFQPLWDELAPHITQAKARVRD
jgi:hypothetical protein